MMEPDLGRRSVTELLVNRTVTKISVQVTLYDSTHSTLRTCAVKLQLFIHYLQEPITLAEGEHESVLTTMQFLSKAHKQRSRKKVFSLICKTNFHLSPFDTIQNKITSEINITKPILHSDRYT